MIESAIFQQNAARGTDAGYSTWKLAATNAVMRHDINDRTAGPMPTFGKMVHSTAMAAQDVHNAYAPAGANTVQDTASGKTDIAYDNAGEGNGYSFADMVDIINPLQQLPVIGTLYRKFTGDVIKPMSSIIGGAIFGGPIGAIGSTINAIIKDRTGKDLAESAFSVAGFDVTTASPRAPDIEYTAFSSADAAKSLAAANLYERAAQDGRKNFANASPEPLNWNV